MIQATDDLREYIKRIADIAKKGMPLATAVVDEIVADATAALREIDDADKAWLDDQMELMAELDSYPAPAQTIQAAGENPNGPVSHPTTKEVRHE